MRFFALLRMTYTVILHTHQIDGSMREGSSASEMLRCTHHDIYGHPGRVPGSYALMTLVILMRFFTESVSDILNDLG
jgi:hypothetical protein